jgi:mRNA-degrading endonuclease RelE of RelBE toxin-antitoxin system
MKAVSDDFIDESEDLAKQSMKAMRAFLTYQGDNPNYYHKAKVAAVGLTNYVRLRATENNRLMVEITAKKQGEIGPGVVDAGV